ncbi:MAG: nucleotidyl transferase AbiEii/AbiGii toxin family protein [Candidatus Berkelbacteria bacterium]|nr:nucleotidyl transferase AbiEii/AbiGii toxin family protein [Candidatus Berkelbacteria bacterium]
MYPEVLKAENKKIFPRLSQFKKFYLAGGTSLALQIGHRISVDFDFFSTKEIDKKLLYQVNQVFPKSKIRPTINNSGELTVFVDDVKLTFLYYPFGIVLKPIEYQNVNLLQIEEIAASKAHTIGRRGSFKDYVDLYFIISKKYCTLEEIIKLAKKKYGDEFSARLFLEQLIYLEDIKDINIIFLKKKTTKKQIQHFFEKEIAKIKF